ncbi:MAG: alpha/beta hydrolase [Gammaproteobacteria bacterium]|nr:alpha/beta hydrolase [Gammaproteobacteria bacterium]
MVAAEHIPGMGAPRMVDTNGIRMALWEAGDGPAVVCCHGFPELAYSWRLQLPALAAAGYRAIAPDQRGYGASDQPAAIEDYDVHHLTDDLAGMLDALGLDRAVFLGHDWGGSVVWSMAQLHPDRVAGVIALNTPFTPRAPADPIEIMRRKFGEDFYMVTFQQPGVADAVFAEHVDKVFPMFFARRGALETPADDGTRAKLDMLSALRAFDPATAPPSLLDDEALQHYTETFRRTGFTGGINWYRNISRNWATTAEVPERVDAPALMISAADDAVLPPSLTEGMERFVPDLERHVIADCGHWTQQERPEETNRLIIDWLQRRYPA